VGSFSDFQKVNKMAGIENLAALGVNPCTAFRMLTDFGKHESVVQNAGNSGVGIMVGQIGGILGTKVISVVRERERNTGADAKYD
jgi:trans-2-enoyl-CoA reductase